jgi:Uma2 family endonuclease
MAHLSGIQPRSFSPSEYYRMIEAELLSPAEKQDSQGRIVVAHRQERTWQERTWNVEEYYRLAALGILHPEERLELIKGQILTMSPQGPLHAETVELIAEFLRAALAGRALVRNEKPVSLSDTSEPVPDLAVVEVRRYSTRHPEPNQIRLIVEVADSSLEYDCKVKSKLYAKAGIQECWVVDIRQRQLHVFTQPATSGYQAQSIFTENSAVVAGVLEGFSVAVRDLLVPD